MLRDELQSLGLTDVSMDEHGYVMGTVPPTTKAAGVPTIGFIAHVDTSPEMSGTGVKPMVRNYGGRDLQLPDEPTAIIRLVDNPDLREQLGHDIVTASGTTLLGADDKAGVAAIVTAAAYLMAHPDIAHGPVRLAFTPDEEIGRGTQHFDVARFGASCAYTLDGGSVGEVESESFSADAMTVTFIGFNTHPGYAKGRMVNAIKVAASFLVSLPADGLSPETTDGHQGFVHPYSMNASVERTSVRLIVRDFETAGLKDKERVLDDLARAAAAHPGARVEIAVEEQYRNMKEVLDRHRSRRTQPKRCGGRGSRCGRTPSGRYHGQAIVHGPADPKPLCGRAQLSLAPGMGFSAGTWRRPSKRSCTCAIWRSERHPARRVSVALRERRPSPVDVETILEANADAELQAVGVQRLVAVDGVGLGERSGRVLYKKSRNPRWRNLRDTPTAMTNRPLVVEPPGRCRVAHRRVQQLLLVSPCR
jgi:tripeptide aminopeptidase